MIRAMSNHSLNSPSDSKKNKPALPFFLSNLRNAQAVIGRAADDLHDRETRPLVGTRQQLQRNAPPSSFSTNLQNFSQRFGSQWRKRGRKKMGHGVTGVPQSFFIAVSCFFFAFPLFFVLFILARHAVFGDEADSSQAHKHEVPKFVGTSIESGKELAVTNMIGIDPEDEIKGVGYIIGVNQTLVNGEAIIDSQMVKEDDRPEALIESATSRLHDETDQSIGDTSDQSVSRKDPSAETNIDEKKTSTKTLHSVAGGGDGNILLQKEIQSSLDLKESDKDNPEQAVPTSLKKENVKTYSSSGQVKENGNVKMEKESSRSNLRGSNSKSKSKEHVKTDSSLDQARERLI